MTPDLNALAMVVPVKVKAPSRDVAGSDVAWSPFDVCPGLLELFGLSGVVGTSLVGDEASNVPSTLTTVACSNAGAVSGALRRSCSRLDV
jgi:hypothetical protein